MTAKTVRGARRVLADAQRNHDYTMRAGVPAWVRAATAARVAAAEKQLQELQQQEGQK